MILSIEFLKNHTFQGTESIFDGAEIAMKEIMENQCKPPLRLPQSSRVQFQILVPWALPPSCFLLTEAFKTRL